MDDLDFELSVGLAGFPLWIFHLISVWTFRFGLPFVNRPVVYLIYQKKWASGIGSFNSLRDAIALHALIIRPVGLVCQPHLGNSFIGVIYRTHR